MNVSKTYWPAQLERFKAAVHILTLILLTPLSLILVGLWEVRSFMEPSTPRTPLSAEKRKTVLLTGGKMSKALHFARCLWKAGHRVILVETEQYWCVGSRFSRAVSAFETVRCPRVDPKGYVEDMVALARKHRVDIFIPVSAPVVSVYDGEVKERLEAAQGSHEQTTGMHFSEEFTAKVDCKHSFGSYCAERGLPAPETFKVNSEAEAREYNAVLAKRGPGTKFVLKNLEYDAMHRLDLFCLPAPKERLEQYLAKLRRDGMPITAEHPWQLQEFVVGNEYSAMAVLRNSKARMITVGESSPSQLNYVALTRDDEAAKLIDSWVMKFVKTLDRQDISGQICFDFIHNPREGTVKVLECNPRVHSQSCVFASTEEQIRLGNLLVEGVPPRAPSSPPAERAASSTPDLEKQDEILRPELPLARLYWFYNELFQLVPNGTLFKYNPEVPRKRDVGTLLKRLWSEKDADFDAADPLPFLFRNHFQLPVRLTSTLLAGRTWKKCDFCIGKVVEVGGD